MDIKELYDAVGRPLSGICDRLYASSRPLSVDSRIDSYIVVELPYRIWNMEIDGSGAYGTYMTTVQVCVYVRDKVSRENPNAYAIGAMSEKVRKVLSVFPIVDRGVSVTRPEVTLQAHDGHGFGVCIVQARLRVR